MMMNDKKPFTIIKPEEHQGQNPQKKIQTSQNEGHSISSGNQSYTKEQENKVKKAKTDYKTQVKQYQHEGYSYTSNSYLKRFAELPQNEAQNAKFPLFHILRGVSKTFMFNEIEIMFFAYVLTENGWKYDIEGIKNLADNSTDMLNALQQKYEQQDITPDLEKEYKCFVLYLCLNAYAVKYYLNNKPETEIIDSHIVEFSDNFITYFQKWSQKYTASSLKINPKKLNYIFKLIGEKQGVQSKNIQEDYNMLVDNIIQISPPYNNSNTSNLPIPENNNNNISNRYQSSNTSKEENNNNQEKSYNNNKIIQQKQQQQQQNQQKQQQQKQSMQMQMPFDNDNLDGNLQLKKINSIFNNDQIIQNNFISDLHDPSDILQRNNSINNFLLLNMNPSMKLSKDQSNYFGKSEFFPNLGNNNSKIQASYNPNNESNFLSNNNNNEFSNILNLNRNESYNFDGNFFQTQDFGQEAQGKINNKSNENASENISKQFESVSNAQSIMQSQFQKEEKPQQSIPENKGFGKSVNISEEQYQEKLANLKNKKFNLNSRTETSLLNNQLSQGDSTLQQKQGTTFDLQDNNDNNNTKNDNTINNSENNNNNSNEKEQKLNVKDEYVNDQEENNLPDTDMQLKKIFSESVLLNN